ncbi:glycoside hydrolase family 32 protein [Glutamicibacter protophormiae]|uniref:glycoside hydrolase family 32 protein n=1 Tax=Glutamicibacter protophormiae TaxID=37930 RepID=UPI003A8EDC59
MRPLLHFTAKSGWINDPHGITYRDGKYDAFFQYVPDSTIWAPNCHWGHASGSDLLTLTELPVALAPGQGDDGVWTGSLITDGDQTRIFYTSITNPDFGIGRVRVATPDDRSWLSWSKGDFVVDAPQGLDIIAYRDPFVRREEACWRMFLGAALRDGTAMALTYTSSDLETWTYDGVALQRSTNEREPVWMGALWECPQVFRIGERAAMVSSVWDADVLHYAGYALGAYMAGRFTADTWDRLTYGDSYYAPSLFMDAEGQPCLSFWMRGVADADAGWASAHSVPYRLEVEGDRMVATPHPDVAGHRISGAPEGRVDGLAADIVWDEPVGEIMVSSGGVAVVRMQRQGNEAKATIAEETHTFPADGALRVILDGPVLEVSSSAGLFGAAVAPTGCDLSVTGSVAMKVYRLG